MKKIFMTLMTALSLGTSAFASEGWLTNFEEAKKQSAETGKTIIADFTGSDWCGWCIKLDNEVFNKKEFKEYAKENLVLFMADFPNSKPQSDELKKQNKELAGKYAITGYPTVLVLDKNGKVLGRTGYKFGGPANYIEHLKKIINKK